MSSQAKRKARPAPGAPPLAVHADALLAVDPLAERVAGGLFRQPRAVLGALPTLISEGRAAFARRMADVHPLAAETLPLREEMISRLAAERAAGRELVLVGEDRRTAEQLAARTGLFDRVLPEAGGLADVQAREAAGPEARGSARAWLRALRPHQWSKNLLVFAPVALGLNQLTPAGLVQALAALVLLCLLASFTYLINDAADLESDRRHWSKRNRPLASGAVPVGHALAVAAFGIPIVLGLAWLVSPAAAMGLALYAAVTLTYSFALKAAPIADAAAIGALFVLRLIIGVAAAGLEWSAWLLTFAAFFFFSLALAKRHTELLRAGAGGGTLAPGRGYQLEDAALTLVLGVSAAMASVLIVVLYLVEEVFPKLGYADPQFLWAAPPILFLWVSRIWLLAHRGQMEDDPVVFALRDQISLGLGALMALAFVLAVI